jgi:ubiquinone biosynthesis protein UbiJ
LAAASVYFTPQYLEYLGCTLNLVENDQLVAVRGKIGFRIVKFAAINRNLQIKVAGTMTHIVGNLPGHSRFACLTRAEHSDTVKVRQAVLNYAERIASNRPCNIADELHICKVDLMVFQKSHLRAGSHCALFRAPTARSGN